MEYGLKILGESPRIGRQPRVVAQCVCGNIKTYAKGDVKPDRINSCGCKPNLRNRQHGMKETREYETWNAMKVRCTNSRHKYWNRYGGRGITVCERWQKFENFYEDMGDRPEGKQLDRIDNNKGYSPDNCRWATPKENNNNKENSIKIELGYIQSTIAELARLGVVSRSTMKSRWHKYGNGWDCLFPPAN